MSAFPNVKLLFDQKANTKVKSFVKALRNFSVNASVCQRTPLITV